MQTSMSQILSETPCFTNRASFFSGRGAILCDLNYKILKHIHTRLVEWKGKDAGKAMVKMVDSMNNMNATDFINNCYLLERSDFIWNNEKPHASGIDIDKDENGNHNIAQAMASMFGMMGGNRDESAQIKTQFLLENKIKSKERIRIDGYDVYFG